MQHLGLTKDDSVLCITSAGDNALHCASFRFPLSARSKLTWVEPLADALAGPPGQQPKRIHAVDMNPCQGHLLELKLASFCALDYEDFWLVCRAASSQDYHRLTTTPSTDVR